MNKRLILSMLATGAITTQAATLTSFSYNQSDATTGSGTIAGFSFSGHTFPSMAMPAATVFSPVAAPAGFVGAQTTAAGGGNEGNNTVGLLWTGIVTATATDGATIQIPLVFAQKVTQSPDSNDYNWNVSFGDSIANGTDVTGAPRFAMWLGRDSVADATDTANLFQRYTQTTFTFTTGATDTFNNTDTSFNPGTIKDATDPTGAPLGTDAAGNPIAFYFGWRDQGPTSPLTGGSAILVDQFNVGGLLEVNEASLVVPEPTTTVLVIGGLGAIVAMRRRKA